MQQPSLGRTPPPPFDAPPVSVPNYLVPAILSLCCGCGLPFGIVSIIYAMRVNSKAGAGDIQGAIAASQKAKMWFIIAAVVGILSGIISGILQIALGTRR
ncbi:MAG TPA: CD225/dispanin family protein [Pyrinomonadaceae bacterium]|jgi:hypothetical protein